MSKMILVLIKPRMTKMRVAMQYVTVLLIPMPPWNKIQNVSNF